MVIGEYWEAAAVTFLFVLGAYLEARTLGRTRRALEELLDLAPPTAIVLRDGEQVEVTPWEVQPGETVVVKPGGRVPVDGEVIGGRRGRRRERDHRRADAGREGRRGGGLRRHGEPGRRAVRARHGVGADTTLARIIRRVEEAQEAKAPTQRFIERFARWYTPAIIALSALAFLVTRDLELALTLLVIGCPGALVISTPVSVVAGIGRAAQRGILIKGGEYLENAGRITALALDKTGTLTRGQADADRGHPVAPRPVSLAAINRRPAMAYAGEEPYWRLSTRRLRSRPSAMYEFGEADVLRWAAIAEANSEHPLAAPILEAARAAGPVPAGSDFRVVHRPRRAGELMRATR